MINSAVNYQISQLLDIYGNVIYSIPRYQREYTWEKREWDEFFDDIFENNAGYFIGSMICINRGIDALGLQKLELVDGQQRMTTLSLMIAAIFSQLKEDNLKWMLVRKMNEDATRVEPQILNNNNRDYRAALSDAGALKSYDHLLQELEAKQIFKAYRHFQNRLIKLSDREEERLNSIMRFRDKILQATLVKIEVPSTADACMLFESLNNRGAPLTSVDLIKNKLFAKLKEPLPEEFDYNYEKWNNLLKYLGNDYNVQERFFRQYYNAFKKILLNESEKKGIRNASIATKSNIIKIYEKIIARNPNEFLENILKISKTYSTILGLTDDKDLFDLKEPLRDLAHIEGTPSYLLILYLIENKNKLKLANTHLVDTTKFLVNFFVRRNLTDRPATNSLTPLFIKIIDEIDGLTADSVVYKIKKELVSLSSNDREFLEFLKGPIYSERSGVARFILCSIEEQEWPSKVPIDVWALNEYGRFIWTIEHILPQGDNIPSCWVDMIAGGDKAKAIDLQQEHMHRLGNLTLTVYNPELSNLCFKEKRDRIDKDGKYIGYRSDLHLNDDIRNRDIWIDRDINDRTIRLAARSVELFTLSEDGENINLMTR